MEHVGICTQLCPKSETTFRIKENLVHDLEKTNRKPDILVKEYRRSAAGRVTSDVRQLRTRQALIATTDYLINEVCGKEDIDWAVIYEFVFDRLRAVRQDLTIQSISDGTTVYILENCVRFYLISVSKLNGRPIGLFDSKINSTHIQESLKHLLNLYATADQLTGKGDYSKNRNEFESIYLLFNLGHTAASQHFVSLPKSIWTGRWCSRAWEYSLAVMEHNYVRAFRLQHGLEELQLCALHHHISTIKCGMLQRMSKAYASKIGKFPIDKLCSLMGDENKQEMMSLLDAHGLVVVDEYVKFSMSNKKTCSECLRAL